MAALEFPCPHCSLTLRARDRTVAGSTIVCPDCATELLIEEEGNGTLFARVHESVSPLAVPAPVAPSPLEKPKRKMTPLLLAGGLGLLAICGVLGVMFLLSSQESGSSYYREPNPETRADESESLVERAEETPPPPDENLAGRKLLHEPAELMQQYLKGTGHIPAPYTQGPADPARRFSWIARLESFRDPDRLEPLWDRPWDDPLNEHFVRRALPHWINPAINQKTSPNRYPATNFVGIAGVGPDAAELLRSHERAGIFGNKGTASLDQLADGASNVWMIAGVQREIGAWAEGGRATIRPWTKGPVIGGPDGFGTGNADSMPILMADGSVRTISADTDPAVLSKLAVIRSQGPTDVVNPGPIAVAPENGPNLKQGMPQFQFDPLRAPKPPEAELAGLLATLQRDLQAENLKPDVDVEKQLAQKLLLFDQPESLPVKTLLAQLQEMSAVPIEINRQLLGDAAERLDDRVRVSLIEPTLKELLEKLLYRAKLGYRIEQGRIIITPEPLELPPELRDRE